jgi:tetratricopeptide (TPR) repeat protein
MLCDSITKAVTAPAGLKIGERPNQPARSGRGAAAIVGVVLLVSLEANSPRSLCAQEQPGEAPLPDTSLQPGEVPRSLDLSGPLDPDTEQLYLLALRHHETGDEDRAEKEFRDVVSKSPREDKYVRSLALFYITRSRYDEALEVIGNYVKLCGVTALGYELEAELLFQQKLYDAALEAALGSLKLSDHNARMHQLLALIHIAKRKDGAAAVELRQAVELDPNHAGMRYLLGRVLYGIGGYAEARDQFLACLKIQPNYRKVLENLGLCYEALQDYPKATQAYHDAISLEESLKGPKHAEPYAFYGAMLAKLGESQKALAVLRQGVAVSPRSFVANYHLGRLLLNLGENVEAEKFLLTAAGLDPKFSRTYYLLGNLRQKQNRRAEAERYRALFKDLDKVPENRVFPLTDR